MWTSLSNLCATGKFLIKKKKEIRLYVKHFGTNNVHTMFGFMNTNRFLINNWFFL